MASSTQTTKPMANGHGHPPDKQQGMLEKLMEAIKIFSSSEGFQAIDELVEDNTNLKTRNEELERKTEEWAIAKREMLAMIHTVQSEGRDAKALSEHMDEELKKSKKQETVLREKLQEGQNKVDVLKKELEANREEISKTMKSSQDKKDEIRKLQDLVKKEQQGLKQCQKAANATLIELTEIRKQHGTASQQLAELEEQAFSLIKVDGKSSTPQKIKAHLDGLFDDAYQLAKDYFSQLDLMDEVFRGVAWQKLKKDNRLADIPLPPTNSQSARQMRAAAVLRLVALAAVEHIFQPVYLTEDGGELGQVLDSIYALDRARAQRVRSVLLKIDTKLQVANGKKRVEAASFDVLESVGPLLGIPDGPLDKQAPFRRDLDAWCQRARQTWMDIQKLEGKFTVLFEEDIKDLRPVDWRRIPDQPASPTQGSGAPANGAKTTGTLAAEDIVALLWPAFFVTRAKDGSSQRCKGGYVLIKSQVATARRELLNARSASDSGSRRGGDAQRRLAALTSGSNNSTEDFGSFL